MMLMMITKNIHHIANFLKLNLHCSQGPFSLKKTLGAEYDTFSQFAFTFLTRCKLKLARCNKVETFLLLRTPTAEEKHLQWVRAVAGAVTMVLQTSTAPGLLHFIDSADSFLAFSN